MINQKDPLFLTIKPKSDLIANHISYYYFHQSFEENYKKDIIYHPHYVTALNVYKNSFIQWDKKGRIYKPNSQNEPSVIFTSNIKVSKKVKQRGNFNKIGIIFKPLGINHFIKTPLSKLVEHRISIFNYYGNSLIEVSNEIFKQNNLQDKRDLLDEFFEKKYTDFSEIRLLKVIATMMNSEEIPKVQDLAHDLNMSRKTLLRLFKKHMCCSVAEFKSVIRFRRALDYYQSKVMKPNLTHVALYNQYYDQPDFIKNFKMVTGFNPKKFFSSLQNISDKGTHWTILP